MTYPYTLTNDSLTVIREGAPLTIRASSADFQRARQALFESRWTDLFTIIAPGLAIETFLRGLFKFADNQIRYGNDPLPEGLNNRLIQMAADGGDPGPWLKFWERLQKNPSYRSVNQLYAFLANEGIPVDKDGYVLAYKSVRVDYKDHHSGTFDNSPGQTVWMPRNKISDDPRVACHEGLHVGALEYARTFGGTSDKRIVICRVDPADVVCVPYDASCMKMRVCEYTVIGNFSGEQLPSTTFIDDPCEDDPEFTFDEDTLDEDTLDEDTLDEDGGDDMGPGEDESPWAAYDKMTRAELEKCLFPDLRKYARHGLQIVGASKMKGTKLDLVQRILEVRRK